MLTKKINCMTRDR